MESISKQLLPVALGASWFLGGLAYSLLYTVFPVEAGKKGLSATEIGLVIGIFELASAVASILVGTFLKQLGPTFVFACGLLTFSCNVALFGFLDWGPGGWIYFVMCLVVRIFQGVSTAAYFVASSATLIKLYPDQGATVLAALEIILNLGMTLGPALGGFLYALGGFIVPFITLAGVSLVYGFAAVYIVITRRTTQHEVDKPEESFQGSVLSVLKIPVVALMALTILVLISIHGLMLSTMSTILVQRYLLSTTLIGLVFLLQAAVVSCGSLFCGWLGSRKPHIITPALAGGLLLCSISFMLFAPAPFLHLPSVPLWLFIVLQVPYGLSVSTYILTGGRAQLALIKAGYPESLETYGLVSGFFNTCLFLALFLGPTIGGLNIDYLGYTMTLTLGAFVLVAMATLLIFRIIWNLICHYHLNKTLLEAKFRAVYLATLNRSNQ